MYFKKLALLGVTTLSVGIGIASNGTTAHARINGISMSQDSHMLVRARKTVPVYRITTESCMAYNKFHFYKYLHKGSTVYTSIKFMSPSGWIIKSGNIYRPTSYTFYLVPDNNHHWYTRIR